MDLSQDRAVNNLIKEGWDPAGKGFEIIDFAYDNMGMRKRMGYVQYMLLELLIIPTSLQMHCRGHLLRPKEQKLH